MPKLARGIIIAIGVLIVVTLIAAAFIHDAQTPRSPVALPLTHSFDGSPTGFTLKYPDGWDYAIPAFGVFLLAPSQTLNGSEAGPSLTIQRAEPLSVVGSVDGALDRYLKNGPLRSAGLWKITSAAQIVQFQGHDARAVELEGADTAGAPAQHTRIIVTTATNTFVYFFVASVPLDKLAVYAPTLDAMLGTVQLLE